MEKGYWVNSSGEVFSSKGKKRRLAKRVRGKDSRLSFTVAVPWGVHPVPVHRLAAYLKFGEAALKAACTRHLDGNSLNNCPDNISIGSHRDNAMDRPEEERRAHAQKAANVKGVYEWSNVEKDHVKNKMGFRKLQKKYGMSTGTLSHHFNRLPGWKSIGEKEVTDWEGVRAHILSTRCTYEEASTKFGMTDRTLRRRLGRRSDLLEAT